MPEIDFNKFDNRPPGVIRIPAASAGNTVQSVIAELLCQIRPVNFRERAELGADGVMKRKTYVVIAIDVIIETATANNWAMCANDGFIYVFNGAYWQAVNTGDFKTFLTDAALRMGLQVMEARYYQFGDELYRQFLAVSHLPTPETKDGVLINLLNGTFEISGDTQQLRNPRREDFIKYQLPFEYDPGAKCPMFDKYLLRVLPDADCRKVLAEYMGYIFINSPKLEKTLILHGSGANGKSVFFDIVSAVLGRTNICSYSLQDLTKDNGYARAELANKLLNYASEINGKLETDMFKQLVSGEPVATRQIYGAPYTMYNYAKLMFNCNELPREVEQTNAYFRRFIIIPFDQTIPEDEQDPNLAKKIIASELSGVFNWILDGLRRLLAQEKFTQSNLVCDQVNTYRRESDSVAMFIDDEGYIPSFGKHVPLKRMYDDYKLFCTDNGYRPCSIQTTANRLRVLRFDVEKRNTGMVFYATRENFKS
jgi:putative DNA primase/helicase